MKKQSFYSTGHTMFTTIFIVLCILFTLDSLPNLLDQGAGFRVTSANLASESKMFGLRLKSEKPDFPVQEMVSTRAWSDFEKKLSEYTRKMEQMDRHARVRPVVISLLCLIAAIGMVICALGKDRELAVRGVSATKKTDVKGEAGVPVLGKGN